jgi:DNA-binding MarR family transcriptional regulator
VEKASCASDARVTYAVLTESGHEKLRTAAASHLADVDRLFAVRFGEDELETLATLLGRIDGDAPPESCEPD